MENCLSNKKYGIDQSEKANMRRWGFFSIVWSMVLELMSNVDGSVSTLSYHTLPNRDGWLFMSKNMQKNQRKPGHNVNPAISRWKNFFNCLLWTKFLIMGAESNSMSGSSATIGVWFNWWIFDWVTSTMYSTLQSQKDWDHSIKDPPGSVVLSTRWRAARFGWINQPE
jgi:hypothetical protein